MLPPILYFKIYDYDRYQFMVLPFMKVLALMCSMPRSAMWI